jgi:hypothetical protein
MFSTLSELIKNHHDVVNESSIQNGIAFYSQSISILLVKFVKYHEYHSKSNGEIRGFLEMHVIDDGSVVMDEQKANLCILHSWGQQVTDKLRYWIHPLATVLLQNPKIAKTLRGTDAVVYYLQGNIIGYRAAADFASSAFSSISWVDTMSSNTFKDAKNQQQFRDQFQTLDDRVMKENNHDLLKFRYPRTITRNSFASVYSLKNISYLNIELFLSVDDLFSGMFFLFLRICIPLN